jgi:hypothetical protein
LFGWPPKVVIDLLFVPDNAGEGVLVLVGKAERVTDFVKGRGVTVVVGKVPTEVHGRLGRSNAKDVPTDIGPGSVGLVEPYPYLRFASVSDFNEFKADRQVLPLVEGVPNGLVLWFRTRR